MSKSQPDFSKAELVTSNRTSSPKNGSTKSWTWTRPFVPLTVAHCSFSVRNEQYREADTPPGKAVDVAVIRDGKEMHLKLTVGQG